MPVVRGSQESDIGNESTKTEEKAKVPRFAMKIDRIFGPGNAPMGRMGTALPKQGLGLIPRFGDRQIPGSVPVAPRPELPRWGAHPRTR